jgi:transcriptional regulator with XRE-family HTH domain
MNMVSQRFRELRESGNYSQEGIANTAGVSQATWSSWERQPPNQFEALARLARHYDVSADYLLGLSNDPTPADRRRMWSQMVVSIANDLMELPDYRQREMERAVSGMVARQRLDDQINLLRRLFVKLVGVELTDLIWERLLVGDMDELLRLLNASLQEKREQDFSAANEL